MNMKRTGLASASASRQRASRCWPSRSRCSIVLGRDLVADALGPVATLSESSADDAAGDALVPDDNGERFLPVPAPLDDDRVVDAIGPLAKLSCHRDDPPECRSNALRAAGRCARCAARIAVRRAGRTGRRRARCSPLRSRRWRRLPRPPRPNAARTRAGGAADMPADCPALLRHQFNRLQTGESQSLCQFQGKVLLIVNTASYCGYTGQYEGSKRSTGNTRAADSSSSAFRRTISAGRSRARTRRSRSSAGSRTACSFRCSRSRA